MTEADSALLLIFVFHSLYPAAFIRSPNTLNISAFLTLSSKKKNISIPPSVSADHHPDLQLLCMNESPRDRALHAKTGIGNHRLFCPFTPSFESQSAAAHPDTAHPYLPDQSSATASRFPPASDDKCSAIPPCTPAGFPQRVFFLFAHNHHYSKIVRIFYFLAELQKNRIPDKSALFFKCRTVCFIR